MTCVMIIELHTRLQDDWNGHTQTRLWPEYWIVIPIRPLMVEA